MKAIGKSALILIAVVVLVSFIGLASAGNAQTASVWTTDISGNPKNEFGLTEKVYIHLNTSPSGTTADVKVTDAANPAVTVAGPWTNKPSGTVIECGPFAAGYYFIVANGAPQAFPIAVGTFFVVPESIFGTLAALGAGFAAFGVLAVKKTNILKGLSN